MIRLTKEQNTEKHASALRKIEIEMQKVRDMVLLYPNKEDHKQFYNENNKRNVCMYTDAKKKGTLLEFDSDAYDSFMLSAQDYDDEE